MQRIVQLLSLFLPRAVLPIMILGGFMLVLDPSPAMGVDKNVMVEFGMFLAGIIGVAAVMRVDVGRLVHWQVKHVETHELLGKNLAELTALHAAYHEETERRLARLEEEEDRRRLDSQRPHGD